jgi:hypothetical protein
MHRDTASTGGDKVLRPGGTLSSLLFHPTETRPSKPEPKPEPKPDATRSSEIPHVEAVLPHASRHGHIEARETHPEPHLPGQAERSLGTALHPDLTAAHHHYGVPCDALPPSHAHPLPSTHRTTKHVPTLPVANAQNAESSGEQTNASGEEVFASAAEAKPEMHDVVSHDDPQP